MAITYSVMWEEKNYWTLYVVFEVRCSELLLVLYLNLFQFVETQQQQNSYISRFFYELLGDRYRKWAECDIARLDVVHLTGIDKNAGKKFDFQIWTKTMVFCSPLFS